MSYLTLSFEPDPSDDFSGRLTVAVDTPDFAGRGCFWTHPGNIELFAASLDAYPIAPDSPPSERLGYNDGEGNDLIIGIRISPADKLGNLLVEVEIADRDNGWRRVRTTFGTHYPELENFRREITRMLRGEKERAVLVGD